MRWTRSMGPICSTLHYWMFHGDDYCCHCWYCVLQVIFLCLYILPQSTQTYNSSGLCHAKEAYSIHYLNLFIFTDAIISHLFISRLIPWLYWSKPTSQSLNIGLEAHKSTDSQGLSDFSSVIMCNGYYEKILLGSSRTRLTSLESVFFEEAASFFSLFCFCVMFAPFLLSIW